MKTKNLTVIQDGARWRNCRTGAITKEMLNYKFYWLYDRTNEEKSVRVTLTQLKRRFIKVFKRLKTTKTV